MSYLDEYGLREIAPSGFGETCSPVTADDGEDIQSFSSAFSALAAE